MSQKNLIPLNMRSKEEIKRITSNGGKKSVALRKMKKEIKERLKIGLEMFADMEIKQLKRKGKKAEAELIRKIGIDIYYLLQMALNDKYVTSQKIKLNAINDIMNRIEGKPIEKNIFEGKINNQELSNSESELIEKYLKKEAEKLKT